MTSGGNALYQFIVIVAFVVPTMLKRLLPMMVMLHQNFLLDECSAFDPEFWPTILSVVTISEL